MNIVCATDDIYVQHCCIMLTSLLDNNEDVSVYILTEGLTDKNQSILREEIEIHGGKYYYVLVDTSVISQLPMPKMKYLSHISTATYYRLLISDLLPINVNKVVYFDCDIIVRKSLEDLWNYNVENYALAAVHQLSMEEDNVRRLNYPLKYGYFNAGVLLINLDYWRKNNIPLKLLDYVYNNYDKIVFHDQDALNAVLYDKSKRLPCKWNMTNHFFTKQALKDKIVDKGKVVVDNLDYKALIPLELKDPAVIHFVSKPKPWQKNCFHQYRKEYLKYALMTVNFRNIYSQNIFSWRFNFFLNEIKNILLYFYLQFKKK